MIDMCFHPTRPRLMPGRLTIFEIQIPTNMQYELHRSEFLLPSYEFFRKKLIYTSFFPFYATTVLCFPRVYFFRTSMSLERSPFARIFTFSIKRYVQSTRTSRYFGISILYLLRVNISNFPCKIDSFLARYKSPNTFGFQNTIFPAYSCLKIHLFRRDLSSSRVNSFRQNRIKETTDRNNNRKGQSRQFMSMQHFRTLAKMYL